MALAQGSRLGPYEISSAIGAGGMGEVYRARDTKLGRDVAIKVLPETFVREPDRMTRFEREAKVLASLNHPKIATIHGLEDSNGAHALVMELVEGPTLADRIRQGPIPIQEALPIAKQICEALEYAHERGIIHRDLKPANIKVSADDTVKVLDFGLAKAIEGDSASFDISTSPTLSRLATMQGVLLGTAAYMSPEQAKAKSVDRRADIWAFGCVLYEMLTGKAAFQGEAVTDTLASVIKDEPDWSLLPTATPMRVRVLLQRCLQKDPKQRLQAIGDARISFDEVLSGTPEAAPGVAAALPSWRRVLPWTVAGLFFVATALLGFLYSHQKPSANQIVRYQIPFLERVTGTGGALSPDGTELALAGSGADGEGRLWVESVAEALDAHALAGTEGASGDVIWSPDSRFIAFFAQGKLKKIAARGGPVVTLCDAPASDGTNRGDWSRGDQILFGTSHGVMEVAASGGSPSLVTTGGPGLAPSFLPDGRHFLYGGTTSEGAATYIGSLGTGTGAQAPEKLSGDMPLARYVSSSDPALGYIVFVRGSLGQAAASLMAQPFDPRELKPVGKPITIADQVAYFFSATAADVLGYVTGSGAGLQATLMGRIQGQLAWFDREGKVLGTFGDRGSYRTLALSPDGKRVAFDRGDPQNPNTRNIWLYEFARGVTTRFTFDSGIDWDPVWSPDGSRIAFVSGRGAREPVVYERSTNLAGGEEILSDEPEVPGSWSTDGRFLLCVSFGQPSRFWLLPVGARMSRKPVQLESSDFSDASPRISPDGRWIAYSSDESGRNEIYVRSFDSASGTGALAASGTAATGEFEVSTDGGVSPLWRRDGKELFYLSSIGGMAMAVEVGTSGTFQPGIPKPLFKVPPDVLFWDVSPDGKRFLMAVPSGANAAPGLPITIVVNWQAALKK